ncbi:MAG: NAD(P)H-dependent glycerol-3-phosphate dehydrogenase [Patescibacteria group bacterium]
MITTIIGTGRIGKALEHLLAQAGQTPRMWDAVPEMPRTVETLEEACKDAGIIILGTPSWAVREVVSEAREYAARDALFVILSKGIEEDTQKTMDLVMAELMQDAQSFALLSGPTMAEEIMQDARAAAVVASPNPDSFDRLQEAFAGSKLTLEFSDELRSVALAAVLKNIYAMLLGISSALEISGNAQGYLFVHIIKEMKIVIERLGGDPEQALSLAGLGDMVLTGFSPHSRNRASGKELVADGKLSKKSEGFTALPSLVSLLDNDLEDLPLLQMLQSIVVDNVSAQEVMEAYLDS